MFKRFFKMILYIIDVIYNDAKHNRDTETRFSFQFVTSEYQIYNSKVAFQNVNNRRNFTQMAVLKLLTSE